MSEYIAAIGALAKKIAPLPLLAIAFASGLILFCPDSLARVLGIDTFRATYRGWIGASLVGSVSYLAAHFVWWLRHLFLDRRERKRRRKLGIKHLHNLTAEEKAYLVPYVFEGVTSQTFQLQDGIAASLVAKHIIFRSSNLGHLLSGFAHNILPWALEYLRQHPQLLEGGRPSDRSGNQRPW